MSYDLWKETEPQEPFRPSIRGEMEYQLMRWEDEHGPRSQWSDGLKLRWNRLVERLRGGE